MPGGRNRFEESNKRAFSGSFIRQYLTTNQPWSSKQQSTILGQKKSNYLESQKQINSFMARQDQFIRRKEEKLRKLKIEKKQKEKRELSA